MLNILVSPTRFMHKDYRVWPSLLARCGNSCPYFRRGYPRPHGIVPVDHPDYYKIEIKLSNVPYCVKAKKGITLDDKHVNFPSFCPLEKPKPE